MNKIVMYTADGTLNMPQEQKEPFRRFAYEELKSAYPDFEIEITKERNTELFQVQSEEYVLAFKKLHSFIKAIFDRWKKINS